MSKPNAHVVAVFEQFPWLKRHFNQARFIDAGVARMDLGFLDRARYQRDMMEELGSDYVTKLYLFTGDGNPLTPMDENKWYRQIQRLIVNPSVRETLELKSNADRCMYGVSVSNCYGLMVYRTPKDCTLPELLQQKRRIEVKALEAARVKVKKS